MKKEIQKNLATKNRRIGKSERLNDGRNENISRREWKNWTNEAIRNRDE